MPSANNDDFLSQIQLTAAGLLTASTYFTPGSGMAIPVTSEVKEDVVQRVKQANPAGLICIVGLGDCRFVQGGGTRQADGLQLIVRVRETVSVNRGSTGTRENCLRVAQKVAIVLDNARAAMSTDGTPASMGGTLVLRSIEPAEADMPGVQAWHVSFDVRGGGLCDFTRRGSAPADGAP